MLDVSCCTFVLLLYAGTSHQESLELPQDSLGPFEYPPTPPKRLPNELVKHFLVGISAPKKKHLAPPPPKLPADTLPEPRSPPPPVLGDPPPWDFQEKTAVSKEEQRRVAYQGQVAVSATRN